MQRRAQTVRHGHHARPSISAGTDDVGMLKEIPDENSEDTLRRQLLEKDRENDRLKTQIQMLQAQLVERPPRDLIEKIENENKNLGILIDGMQRENEKAVAEMERMKIREKMLERHLAKFAGPNWQDNLEIPSSSPDPSITSAIRGSTLPSQTAAATAAASAPAPTREAVQAHLEQVRLLILGMEKRLGAREDALKKTIARAENEGQRFEELGRSVSSTRA